MSAPAETTTAPIVVPESTPAPPAETTTETEAPATTNVAATEPAKPAEEPAKPKKQILVVGAGSAGIPTTHYLLRFIVPSLPDPSSYHVTLIDPSTKWANRVAAPRSLVSEKLLPLSRWMLDLEPAFKSYGDKFSFIQGTATSLDTSSRIVTVEKPSGVTESLNYYALIITTGATTHTPLMGTTKGHTVTQEAIEAFRKKLPDVKSIVIAGGGPAGVETAGELGHYLNGRAGLFSARLTNPKVPITLVTNADKLLPVLRPALSKKAEKLLAKVGVKVLYNAGVTSTVPENAGRLGDALLAPTAVTLANGEVLEADVYIPAYGLVPNSSWLPGNLKNSAGKIETNAETLRVDAAGPRVYAVGEVGSYTVAGGIFELQFAALPTAWVNIKRDLLHDAKVESSGNEKLQATGKDKVFASKVGETQIVPVSRSTGVGALFGWRVPGFVVWLIKGRQYLTELNGNNIKGGMVKEEKWKDM